MDTRKETPRYVLVKKFVDLVSEEIDMSKNLKKATIKRKEMLVKHPFLGIVWGQMKQSKATKVLLSGKRKLEAPPSSESTPRKMQKILLESELKKQVDSIRSKIDGKSPVNPTQIQQVLGLSQKLGMQRPDVVSEALNAGLVVEKSTGLQIDEVM